ncbi:hypothetical protein [Tautonia rosea]|uniref:hypothetical protein n=1 Tax=Tautonia rosea TaxID=2728037 RepID=UPI0014766BC4|nr:hypothetical protein [Tautonia rosea]
MPPSRGRALLLARALDEPTRVQYELEQLRDTLATTAKQNKRRKPSTFELLNDPEQLDYSLT